MLWGVNWTNIQMMLADAPRYKRVKPKPKMIESEEELADFLGISK